MIHAVWYDGLYFKPRLWKPPLRVRSMIALRQACLPRATGVCKKKAKTFTKISRVVYEIFAKFSKVFGSFWKLSEVYEVFGRVRMRSDVFELFLAEKKRKTETKWLDTKHAFLRCFEKLRKDRAGHTPPHRSKQNKKNKVCLKWKFRSWRFKRCKNRQNRSYPRGVKVRSKFLLFYVFGFFFADTGRGRCHPTGNVLTVVLSAFLRHFGSFRMVLFCFRIDGIGP